jgi:hypothetical protein
MLIIDPELCSNKAPEQMYAETDLIFSYHNSHPISKQATFVRSERRLVRGWTEFQCINHVRTSQICEIQLHTVILPIRTLRQSVGCRSVGGNRC